MLNEKNFTKIFVEFLGKEMQKLGKYDVSIVKNVI